MTELVFPDGFLWGAATAAHQVEGDNTNSDWWAWELRPDTPCREPSGTACDHYRRYPEDVAMLAGIGLNTYRYSVEWARVEPSEGTFDEAALDHYRAMTDTVIAAGMTPMVTLNHFTLPAWLADMGGWTWPRAGALFGRYCRRVAEALGDRVDWYCTINEPSSVAFGGYLGALGFPPGREDVDAWEASIAGLNDAHRRGRAELKEVRPTARVGATHAMLEWEARGNARSIMTYMRRMTEDVFLEACGEDDFVGVQTYTRIRVELGAPTAALARAGVALPAVRRRVIPTVIRNRTRAELATGGAPDGARRTQMGNEYRPEAVAATIRRTAELLPGKPIVVTEHGVSTADDAERAEFIVRGLAAIHGLIDEGLPVGGYVYWSALDNFEWARGYGMTFGIIGVDRTTQARTIRPSAWLLGGIARGNRLVIPGRGAGPVS